MVEQSRDQVKVARRPRVHSPTVAGRGAASAAERGQEAAEFALIFPVLFLLLMAIFDLGRVTYYNSALHNAVREGARYGVINPGDVAGIEALVKARALGMPAADVTVSVSSPSADEIRVTAEYPMPIITPLIGQFFGGSNTVLLGSQATMRVEN